MKRDQIALQLWTVRAHLQDAASFASSMKRLREIGYRNVQMSGQGPIPSSELKRICDGEGIRVCATHENGKTIIENPAEVVDTLGVFGCKDTSYAYPHVPLANEADAKALATSLNRSGERLAAAGIRLTYHNHAIEFKKAGRRPLLDILYAETDPRFLQGEIDVYWVQAGGADPVAWCERLKGRLPLVHLKDYGVNADNKPRIAELGNGNLDFPRIVAAAEASGCEWFIVEQDADFEVDAFDSARQSLAYLNGLASA
jgi:sugar phosphate isomerase/epimerase